MEISETTDHFPLLVKPSADDHRLSNSNTKRTGTTWTAVAHIITGVIGSGVLSLAWSMAQLGWLAGPFSMIIFAAMTLASVFLVCDVYRYPDPEYGPMRNTSYSEAVHLILGKKKAWACGLLMNMNFYGTGIAYVITSAICMRAIRRSNCYHEYGHEAPCDFGDTPYMLIFGLIQVITSQIPDFHGMAWLSILAAVMSFAYSSIGLGLGAAKVVGDGVIKGSIGGISTSKPSEKFWLICQAIGDICFAFPYTTIVPNIQDTLASPPPESQTMKRASIISILVTTFFYVGVGGFGYAAFGDRTPGNLMTGFGFYEPYWLVDFANVCIVVHLIGGYQVYSQPVFALADKWFRKQYSESAFVSGNYAVKVPLLRRAVSVNLWSVCFRMAYVASTASIAMLFPYFNLVLGVIGALNFWPLSVYFPVEMWLVQNKVEPWCKKWVALRCYSVVCFVVAVLAFVSSIEGIVAARFR